METLAKEKIKCKEEINDAVKIEINNLYWSSSYDAQRMFICESVHKSTPKRVSTGKKSSSFIYTLKKRDGKRVNVCKSFF